MAARVVEETSESPGRWRCSFECSRFTRSKAETACDAWARAGGYRTLSAHSHERGFLRDFVSPAVRVTFGFAVVGGSAAAGEIVVEADADAPPTERIPRRTVEIEGLRFPLPRDAVPDVHDDLRDVGGDDLRDFFVPSSFAQSALVELYLPWAAEEGFVLVDRFDEDDLIALGFGRGPLRVHVSLYPCLDGGPSTLRLGLGMVDRAHG